MISRRTFVGALAGLPLIGRWFTPRAPIGTKQVVATHWPIASMTAIPNGVVFIDSEGVAWMWDGNAHPHKIGPYHG